MSDLKLYEVNPGHTFEGAADPTQSEAGAQVTDVYLNTTSGEEFRCRVATLGSQEWDGGNGTQVPVPLAAILATDHPNLIAMYTMDNISGATLVDESPNANNGTITGATAVAGQIGNGLFFGASSSDRVKLTSVIESVVSGDFSFSFFVDYQTQSTAFPRFIEISDALAKGVQFFYYRDTNEFGLDLIGVLAMKVASPLTSGLKHIVCNYERGVGLEVFVEGVSVGTHLSASVPTTPSSSNIYLGNTNSLNRVLDGILDEFRIFDRILTTEEITALYNEGTP
ncbi:LamG domain-containing protein [bacterium]|nr:LamG domain-containing protein [bacterium]